MPPRALAPATSIRFWFAPRGKNENASTPSNPNHHGPNPNRRLLQKRNADIEPARLGRLRRPNLHPRFRNHPQLQNLRLLHGFQRRTSSQTPRRQGQQLRRHQPVQRRSHDDHASQSGRPARPIQNPLLPTNLRPPKEHAASPQQRQSVRRPLHLGTQSTPLRHNSLHKSPRHLGRLLGSQIQRKNFR